MKTIANRFFSSINIKEHPLINCKTELKTYYYCILTLFSQKIYKNDFTIETLEEYKKIFNIQSYVELPENKIISYFLKPWRKKHLILLVYDLYLINCPSNVSLSSFKEAIKDFAIEKCTSHQYTTLCKFTERVFSMQEGDRFIDYGSILKQQIKSNQLFLNEHGKRIVFTANMSSGKSTIINAIIGKKIAKTAQEVCTGNISYIYNKPFEDGHIHLIYDHSTINADIEELLSNNWDKEKYISSYFDLVTRNSDRLCLIDTPGVNSSMNRQHGRITRSTLEQREYDVIVHVLNAQQLGTDEELSHLRWIKNNISDRIVIFVLNKLDVFNTKEDSIDGSMAAVKEDLERIGFVNPIICPISAYFAFLIKQKKLGVQLSEDEQDEYDLYVKKFNKPIYDLSRFYPKYKIEPDDDEATVLLKKCGFYGFEKTISGGIK